MPCEQICALQNIGGYKAHIITHNKFCKQHNNPHWATRQQIRCHCLKSLHSKEYADDITGRLWQCKEDTMILQVCLWPDYQNQHLHQLPLVRDITRNLSWDSRRSASLFVHHISVPSLLLSAQTNCEGCSSLPLISSQNHWARSKVGNSMATWQVGIKISPIDYPPT